MSRRITKRELIDMEIKRLSYSYIFLLSSLVVLFVAINSFTTNIFGYELSYSVFILPFIFCLLDIILKEVGYKEGITAVIISSITLLFISIISDTIFVVDNELIKYFYIVLAYSSSQFINLLIYYFMLDNYRTPYILVVLNLVFSCLIYNMVNMIFVEEWPFSDEFWEVYIVIIIIQLVLSIFGGLILKLVKQGINLD